MITKRFNLNIDEVSKVAKNSLIFLAPALIAFFTALQSGVPIKDALYVVYLWALNTAVDLLRKFTEGRK